MNRQLNVTAGADLPVRLGAKSGRSAEPSAAFSLKELLVVVAMISALGVLALSARPTAGNGGALAQCINNAKQLCQATRMYALDNQEYLPFPNWGTANTGWLYTPLGGVPPPLGTNAVAAYQGGLLWHYTQSLALYSCPADPTNGPARLQRQNQLSTYVMNGAVNGFSAASPSAKLSAFKFSSAVLFWEPPDVPFMYNDGASFPDASEGPNRRHITGSVIGCLDGHAQFLRYDAALPLMRSSTANEFWCNPASANGH